MNTIDYDAYLLENETTDSDAVKDGMVLVKPGTLRQRKARAEAHLSEAEKEQLAEQRAATAYDHAEMKRLDIRWFGESGYNKNAETLAEEVHIHRQMLRCLLGDDTVLPGETLRQLASRTWYALLNHKNTNTVIYPNGRDAWFAGFNPTTGKWVMYGWMIKDAAVPGSHEAHWKPPADCTGDEPIDITKLPPLPVPQAD